jgi:putative phage-type endonuclease
VTLAVRIGSPEWLDARRSLITATDIPVLLGISPYKCEADLADEKRGLTEPSESTLRMRVGLALEDLIAEEYTRATGRQVRRFRSLVTHPELEWAAASPDGRAVGERRLVEMKWTGSRSRFADGVPQDVEAQVVWQMGVTGYPVADVAALVGGDDLLVSEVPFDAELFDNLVVIATDFRRRLEEGGPFSRDTSRIKRDHPSDNGAEMVADADMDAAAKALYETRARRKVLEQSETALEDAIKSRMGDVAVVRGSGWHATWKRTKDREETDWRSLADGLLRQLPEPERTALVGIHSSVRQGFRPFRLVVEKEDES